MKTEEIISKHVDEARFLSFHVNLGTMDEYINLVAELIQSKTKANLFNHNLHTLYLYYKDKLLQHLYRDSVVVLDGMPLVWLARLFGFNANRQQRVTYAQFIWPLLARAESEGWNIFYVGASDDIQADGFENIRAKYPQIKISGAHGYFDIKKGSQESEALIQKINDANTDLLIVGMGTPRQEYWLGDNREAIDAPAALVSGACLEYVAGRVGTPPKWTGQLGLEWAYRLIENPKRFAWRYLVEPWALIGFMVSAKLRKN